MREIVVIGLIALTISAPLLGCREDEKQGAKDAVREFLAEEDSKAQTERNRFLQGRGDSRHTPANPFASAPKESKDSKGQLPNPARERDSTNIRPDNKSSRTSGQE